MTDLPMPPSLGGDDPHADDVRKARFEEMRARRAALEQQSSAVEPPPAEPPSAGMSNLRGARQPQKPQGNRGNGGGNGGGNGHRLKMPNVGLPKFSMPKGKVWPIILGVLLVALVGVALLGGPGPSTSLNSIQAQSGPAPLPQNNAPLPSMQLPQLQTKEPWQVPETLPDMFANINLFASWLGFPVLIVAVLYAFYRERQAAGQVADFYTTTMVMGAWVVLSVFARGVGATISDPLWFIAKIKVSPIPPETVVLGAAVITIAISLWKSWDGVRDFTPLGATLIVVGSVLVWSCRPESALRQYGEFGIGAGGVVMILEFCRRDPISGKRRPWSFIAGTAGFVLVLVTKQGIGNVLLTALGSAMTVKVPIIQQITREVLFPLVNPLAIIFAVILGGVVAVWGGGKMIEVSERLTKKSLGAHDKWDAFVWLLFALLVAYLLRGGI